MTYDMLAERLMEMHWQERLFQVFGMMCQLTYAGEVTAKHLRAILKIVQRDLEQFTFRGGGHHGNITESEIFISHRDFLGDIYYPVVRVTARRASGNSLPRQPLDYFTPELEATSFQELDNYIINLIQSDDERLDRAIEATEWMK